MKKILFSTVFTALSALSVFAQTSLPVGTAAPTFTVTDVHGVTHDLTAITGSGKWVLIDFFFTTCGPCQAVAPYVTELYNKYGCNEGDLFVISIDTGDSDADVLAYEASFSGSNPGPSVSGNDGGGNAVVSAYGVSAFPTIVLIGSDGNVKLADIFPVSSVATFDNAFSGVSFSPTVMACANSGITENAFGNNINLFPNPSNENTTVSLVLKSENEVVLSVHNLLGEQVASHSYKGVEGENSFELNTNELSSGNYIVNVTTGESSTQLNLSVLK